MRRDFTYIADIVEGVVRVLDKTAEPNSSWTGGQPDPGTSCAPYRLYNIGNNSPVELLDYISAIENGKREIGVNVAIKLCAIFPVTLEKLLIPQGLKNHPDFLKTLKKAS